MIRLKIVILLIFLSMITLSFKLISDSKIKVSNETQIVNTFKFDSDVSSMKLYFCIEKYSKEYNIPSGYLYSIAYHETKYSGPNNFHYTPIHISSGNAYGPMQVVLSTAKMFDKNITKEELLLDIDSNVKISAKLLRHLYNKYGDWEIVIGAYGTGYPIRDSYSQFVKKKTFEWE